MTRKEIIEYCLTLPGAYEDYPFDKVLDDSAWTAMRHRANKKCFAFISVWNGRLIANLKCDPMEADFLRQAFRGVIPGYHMNKTHWNTVYLDAENPCGSDVPDEAIKNMVCASYDLIKPKIRKRRV